MLNTLPPYCIKSNRLARDPASCRLAHYEGRVADENAIGGNARFAGSLGTQVLEVFDVAATRTGLRDREGIAAAMVGLEVHHNGIAPDISFGETPEERIPSRENQIAEVNLETTLPTAITDYFASDAALTWTLPEG